MRSDDELVLFLTDEEGLNELCEGRMAGHEMSWPARGITRYKGGTLSVLARKLTRGAFQPLAMVIPKEDQRRQYGRFSSLRTNYSPLSSWCHVIEPRIFEALSEPRIEPSLNGLDASWSGLAIAEAILLAGRPADALKLAGCLATATFAVARASALWPQYGTEEILSRYEDCNKLVRGSSVPNRLLQRLEPIWYALLEAAQNVAAPRRGVTRILNTLKAARDDGVSDDAHVIMNSLDTPSDFGFLFQLDSMSPEERVSLFDHLIREIAASEGEQKEVFAFLAGYVTTVAAGGLPSLSLAEQISSEWPEVLAWAYVVGGLGEQVTWSSTFHGLGRLVWRELSRPFHLDDAPSCDFSLDEALCLIDRQLNDPLVHLKVKQQRLVSVSILPGVNVNVPLGENQETRAAPFTRSSGGRVSKELSRLANDLWPLIEARLAEEGYIRDQEQLRSASQRKRGGQGRLPLK